MNRVQKILIGLMWLFAALLVADAARAERIKDLASIAGVRDNQLVGYGIVVGLDGSGDQTTQTPFTVQSVLNMLLAMGVNTPVSSSLQLKNVAAVMVTAALPPFARSGQQIDVTVSSIGNAKSLRGGTLVLTPLKGADGAVYAMAQGNVVIGGAGASAGGAKVAVNQLSSGRIPSGATVEKEVAMPVGQGDIVRLDLNSTDFGTARQMADAINRVAPGTAIALDGRTVQVRAPIDANDRVRFLGLIQDLTIQPDAMAAKVIVNARTGSVVMNQMVTIQDCAVAHGNLSVSVSTENAVSQPNPASGGQTAATTNAQIDVKQESGALMRVPAGAKLADIVKALNALGANPQDLISILQAMKSAGSLRAELEII